MGGCDHETEIDHTLPSDIKRTCASLRVLEEIDVFEKEPFATFLRSLLAVTGPAFHVRDPVRGARQAACRAPASVFVKVETGDLTHSSRREVALALANVQVLDLVLRAIRQPLVACFEVNIDRTRLTRAATTPIINKERSDSRHWKVLGPHLETSAHTRYLCQI